MQEHYLFRARATAVERRALATARAAAPQPVGMDRFAFLEGLDSVYMSQHQDFLLSGSPPFTAESRYVFYRLNEAGDDKVGGKLQVGAGGDVVLARAPKQGEGGLLRAMERPSSCCCCLPCRSLFRPAVIDYYLGSPFDDAAFDFNQHNTYAPHAEIVATMSKSAGSPLYICCRPSTAIELRVGSSTRRLDVVDSTAAVCPCIACLSTADVRTAPAGGLQLRGGLGVWCPHTCIEARVETLFCAESGLCPHRGIEVSLGDNALDGSTGQLKKLSDICRGNPGISDAVSHWALRFPPRATVEQKLESMLLASYVNMGYFERGAL